MRLKRFSLPFFICFSLSPALSKDLGKYGEVFDIAEPSLLEVIRQRLAKLKEEGRIEALQKDLQVKAAAQIERPAPIKGITKVRKGKKRYYKPTFVVSQDIADHKNRIFIKAGTSFNPLSKMSFGEPLLFIDGDDETQIQWSLSQKGKVVLIKGAPLALSRAHQRPFYFDQGAVLTEKLGITEVPALVRQKGDALEIEEVQID